MTLWRKAAWLALVLGTPWLAACGGGSGRYTGTDLIVTGVGPSGVLFGGDTAQFVMTVTNDGDYDASDVTITNLIGNQMAVTSMTCSASRGATCPETVSVVTTVPSLPAGGKLTFEVDALVAQGANGTLSNTMTASFSNENDRGDNSATATATASGNNLSVTGTAPPGPLVDATASFTTVVKNSGPSGAQNVTITNVLSANLAPAGPIDCVPAGGAQAPVPQSDGSLLSASMPVDATLTCTIPVTVALGSNGLVSTTMTVAAQGDARTADNVVTLFVQATLFNNVGISAVATSDTVPGGGTTTFGFVVTNSGPAAATDVVLVNTLGANITPAGAITCVGSGGAADATAQPDGSLLSPSMPAGSTLTCSVPATVATGTIGRVGTTMTVTAAGDQHGGDNSATASIVAVRP